ncbi:MAG: hypothetical protein IPK57_18120 [Chitinophagaceae bacterium]|nr:hypothetical protein [Chitinophagaceae bacterium]
MHQFTNFVITAPADFSFTLPRFTSFILSLINEKESVIRFVINIAIKPAIRKIKAFRLMMVTKN